MPSFNPYRSARNRRWHPKYSLSPRDPSAPVADAAITGTPPSPAARLIAAAAVAPPSPARNVAAVAAPTSPTRNPPSGLIAEAAFPPPFVMAPAAVFTAPFVPADTLPNNSPDVSASPAALAAPAVVDGASSAFAPPVDAGTASAAVTLAAPASVVAVASADASVDASVGFHVVAPPVHAAPAFAAAADASIVAPVDVGGHAFVPTRLVVESSSPRTRSPSPAPRSPIDPSGAYDGQFPRQREPIDASPTKNREIMRGENKERAINLSNSDDAGDVEMAPPPSVFHDGSVDDDKNNSGRSGDNQINTVVEDMSVEEGTEEIENGNNHSGSVSNTTQVSKHGIPRSVLNRTDGEGEHSDVDAVYIGRHGHENPTHYDTYWKYEKNLSSVISDSRTVTNGDCGYDALQHTIRQLQATGTPLPDWLEPTAEGRLKLRIKIYEHAMQNAAESMMNIHGEKERVDDKFPERVRDILL